MDLKYYVLGHENNKMLEEYLEKYYLLLCDKLSYIFEIFGKEIENKYLQKKYILLGDNSSQINILFLDIKKSILNKESFEKLIFNFFNEIDKNDFIPGTNIYLGLNDLNPLNQVEAHPDHKNTGGILGYGEKSRGDWMRIYKTTFDLLKIVDEGFYLELNKIIQKIIPLGTSYNMHNSASYKECVGHLYLGLTLGVDFPEFMNLEAIIHESSHNKLNLIMHFDNIILNGNQEIYYSSIRPDARHIKGILLGAHAFVPTMYIMVRAVLSGKIKLDKNLELKLSLYYFKTKLLYKVLSKYAEFTLIGKEIFEEIGYVIKLLDNDFKKLKIEKTTLIQAKNIQKEHFDNVCKNYRYLQY